MGKAAASSPAGDLRERRFSGTLGDDYELWRLARPFLGEVHEVVVRAVRSFTQARDRPLRALDIGMGMGDGAIIGLLLGDAQLAVTGVDNEPKMIKKRASALRRSLQAAGPKSCSTTRCISSRTSRARPSTSSPRAMYFIT
jgi:SAM-dependent methyltransferase